MQILYINNHLLFYSSPAHFKMAEILIGAIFPNNAHHKFTFIIQ